MNFTEIGNIGEAKVIFECAKRNIPCYQPCGEGYKSDLIIEVNYRLYKIQVKTCDHPESDTDVMIWRTTRQSGYHGNRVEYNENEVDYFAFYCISTDTLCFVKYDKSLPKSISIRLDTYNGIRLSTMRFASDYSFDKVFNLE